MDERDLLEEEVVVETVTDEELPEYALLVDVPD